MLLTMKKLRGFYCYAGFWWLRSLLGRDGIEITQDNWEYYFNLVPNVWKPHAGVAWGCIADDKIWNQDKIVRTLINSGNTEAIELALQIWPNSRRDNRLKQYLESLEEDNHGSI